MMKPQRIQLKRVKGFNLQAVSRELNGLKAVSVARPHLFGNPFKPGEPRFDGEKQIGIYTEETALEDHARFLEKSYVKKFTQYYLRGKNLACFCKLENRCHADDLLRVANEDL